MKLKIYILMAILFFTTIGTYLIFKKSYSQRKNEDSLVIGTASGYAPWVSVNDQGQLEGFDIDVIKEIAKKLNKKLFIEDLGSMTSLLMALDQNKVDAIIWGLSITKDRLKKIAMVRYQGDKIESFPLLFWKQIPNNIKTVEDMKGMIVCVEPASSQDTVLSRYKFITKMPTEKVDDALLNIQYAKANAAFVEPAIAKKFKNKYQELQILNVKLAPEDQTHGVGICIKPSNTKLINQIQQATDFLTKNGTIKKFEAKWDIS